MEENKTDKKNILIVSGGTGGHIFPAAVFGRWAERERGARVAYLAGSRPLEGEIYSSLGIVPHVLSMTGSPLGAGSFLKNLKRIGAVLRAFPETKQVLKQERPDACLLFGGYVSFAPLLLCLAKKIPLVVHEQNSAAGRVTRLASRLGAMVASGWRECWGIPEGKFFPVGIPVRPPFRMSRPDAMNALGVVLSDSEHVIGVVGGSLGSQSLMSKITRAAKLLLNKRVVFLVLSDNPGMEAPPNLRFIGRRWSMDPFYSLCDAVVCRAGASTLGELMAWGLPALIVPWKGSAEAHQERNARSFADLTGASVWTEDDADSFEGALESLSVKRRGDLNTVGEDACSKLWSLL